MSDKNQNATKNEKNHKKLTPEAVALVIEGLEADKPQAEIARDAGVSPKTISLWLNQARSDGEIPQELEPLREYLQPNELALMMPKIKEILAKAALEMQEVQTRQVVRVHSLTKKDWEAITAGDPTEKDRIEKAFLQGVVVRETITSRQVVPDSKLAFQLAKIFGATELKKIKDGASKKEDVVVIGKLHSDTPSVL